MTPSDLAKMAVDAINAQAGTGIAREHATISIVTPRVWKPKSGFPRGEVILVKPNGETVRHIGAARVLSWMLANDMIEIAPAPVASAP